jgi:flagellar hook-associated protein 2
MPIFQIGGLATGLNTNELIDQLMQLERQPVVRLEQRQLELKAKAAAWSDVRNRLINLLNRVDVLRTETAFTGKKVISGDEGVITATAASQAMNACYRIKVLALASPQRNISGRYQVESIDTPLGVVADGEEAILIINITKAGEQSSTEIAIDGKDSLLTIRDKINKSAGGITANIIDNRLILTGAEATTFTLADDQGGELLQGLKLTEQENMQVTTAYKASVEIDGVTIESDSNTITGVIPGLTINLQGTSPKDSCGEPQAVTLQVKHDHESAFKGIKALIEQYNSTYSFISNQLAYRGEGEKQGNLFGESALFQIQSRLRQLVTNPVDDLPSGLCMLSQLGISTGAIGTGVTTNGQLELDEDQLLQALKTNPEAVAELFINGIVPRLRDELRLLTKSTDGVITGREQGVQAQIKDIQRQLERWEVRLKMREESLVRQFTALEQVIGQMNNQGSWLTGQINSLAAWWRQG